MRLVARDPDTLAQRPRGTTHRRNWRRLVDVAMPQLKQGLAVRVPFDATENATRAMVSVIGRDRRIRLGVIHDADGDLWLVLR